MKRKIYNKLLEWKNDRQGKVAVLIDGARRIGKSWVAEEFARNEYKSYIILDFNNIGNNIKELFENYLADLDEFFSRLSIYTSTPLYERESVIVFDEVQMFPRARAAIKYLVKDGRYDFIETGSLVSINHNVKDIVIPSEELHLDMYPMDLEEFMWATGRDILWERVADCFKQQKPLGQPIHRQMMESLRAYMLVGGMPQAVAAYCENKDFRRVEEEKRAIISLYRNDISKYAGRQAPIVSRLFDSIPEELQKHEKRLSPGALKKGSRMREYEEAIFWLEESRVVNFCYAATEPSIGLALKRENSKIKVYMGDTGLLVSMAFSENELEKEGIYEKILRGKLEFNKGMLTENLVSQMMCASGHKLYFFSSYSKTNAADRMEIDFLLRKSRVTIRHNILPIEVKSSSRYALSSLEKFLAKYKSYVGNPFVIHTSDLKVEDGIIYLPIYMTPFL